MNNKFLQGISDFVRRIDAKSWPAFFMFVVVLTATGWMNYYSMSPVVGGFGAIAIACFFGVGVLAWHIVESRTDDSEYQEGVAQVAKWLNVVLDAVLLVVNLFRSENPRVLDWVAFIIIGISASSHVGAFLLWTQNDPRRAIRKEGERALSNIDKKRQRATNAIHLAGEELKFEKWLIDEEKRLRAEYGDIDPTKVNMIVQNMQKEARRQFEAKSQNNQKQPPQRPQEAPGRTQLAPSMSETKAEELADSPTKAGRD